MEADCEDGDSASASIPKIETSPDLNQFLSTITSHITDATTKMTSDFNKVLSAKSSFKQEIMDANKDFKHDIRNELAELRDLFNQQQRMLQSLPAMSSLSTPPVVPAVIPSPVSSSVPISNNAIPSSNLSLPVSTSVTSTDQVLLMLTDSFSKMANALT